MKNNFLIIVMILLLNNKFYSAPPKSKSIKNKKKVIKGSKNKPQNRMQQQVGFNAKRINWINDKYKQSNIR